MRDLPRPGILGDARGPEMLAAGADPAIAVQVELTCAAG
jgi:hypothetical protein